MPDVGIVIGLRVKRKLHKYHGSDSALNPPAYCSSNVPPICGGLETSDDDYRAH